MYKYGEREREQINTKRDKEELKQYKPKKKTDNKPRKAPQRER
jgi:hypothetical protein